MKTIYISCLFLFLFASAKSQSYNTGILDSLQNIIKENDQSKYFASVYCNAVRKTNEQAYTKKEAVRKFVFDFEASFSHFFLEAHRLHKTGGPMLDNWKPYYAADSLNELQYMIIGINAHINGDFWKALVQTHSYDSIRKYKRELIRFQSSLNFIIDSLYKEKKQYKKVRTIHTVTLGLDKLLAHQMILQWRKKQIRLSLLYYRNHHRLDKKLKRLHKQSSRFDRFAVRWLC